MPSFQTMVDYALQQALVGIDQLQSALLDADMTMESLVGQVFQAVALDYAGRDSNAQSLLRRTHTITLTDGVGVLPDLALSSCIWGSTVDVSDEPTLGPVMSYVPWVSFVSPSDNQLGYYTIRGDQEFYWTDPDDPYPPVSGRTGDIDLTIASTPAIPAANTDPVVVPPEVFSDLVTALSVAIRGIVQRKAA